MLGWFITPSQRWENAGSLTICSPSLQPLKTFLKIQQLCSLTTGFWYVKVSEEYNLVEGRYLEFNCNFLFFQGISSLTAITGLYLFSRRMLLPRRAKVAISLLTAMAYTQVLNCYHAMFINSVFVSPVH